MRRRKSNKMESIGDSAKAYEPKHMKTIAELEAVSVKQEIVRDEERTNDVTKEKYTISYVTVMGEEYRVPNSVLEQLQTLLEVKPDLKTFKVSKKGEGMNTKYTVIQLE